MSESQREPVKSAPKQRPKRKKWSDVVSSSRQVWLAGLGALAEAQSEGGKALDALIKRGHEVEQRLARDGEAGRRLPPRREPRPSEKLGLLFEQRVARAIDRLGMRPAVDITRLAAHVERLSARVDTLSKQLSSLETTTETNRPRIKREK